MAGSQQLLLGEGAGGAEKNYIEDVFSTWLSTGDNSSSRAIVNGIDLATKGGLVWGKRRDSTGNNQLYDTARGVNKYLISNDTGGQGDISPDGVNAFNTNGFSTGVALNTSPYTYAYWTFRKQPKFYTQGTFTGNGANRTISHDLGSAPGMIIVKRTDSTAPWIVYHRSLGATKYIFLNSTSAASTGSTYWNNTDPTSTVFSLGTEGDVNGSGGTFVYYAFAHDAGGFGLTGTDNVISCGSFTTDGSGNATVNLGYEPQWLTFKSSDAVQDWYTLDTMRGFTALPSASAQTLRPNTSAAEQNYWANVLSVNSTGFAVTGTTASRTFIYIAIRRGPMKVPTDATKVFAPNLSAAAQGTVVTTNFPVDFQLSAILRYIPYVWDRLRGVDTYGNISYNTPTLRTSTTGAEATNTYSLSWNNTGFAIPNGLSGTNTLYYSLRRAPSFFDEVCYTGTGSNMTVSHNLGVAPELMIVKRRNTSGWNWAVYAASQGATNRAYLNDSSAFASEPSMWNSTAPTASVFSVGSGSDSNPASGATLVAYLFATCAGVSKVTNFTGNGSSQTINCGFTAGARFVMIKRTDSTGDWFIFDTSRGISSGNDPHLSLNTTAAEVTSDDTIDPDSTGFIVNQVAATNCNVNSATYIVLAIA